MLSRLADRFWRDPLARLVTGPLAFLVAGLTDVMAFVIASLWFRGKRRLSRGRTSTG